MENSYKNQKNAGKVLVLASFIGVILLFIELGVSNYNNAYFTPSLWHALTFAGLMVTCLGAAKLMDTATEKQRRLKQVA